MAAAEFTWAKNVVIVTVAAHALLNDVSFPQPLPGRIDCLAESIHLSLPHLSLFVGDRRVFVHLAPVH